MKQKVLEYLMKNSSVDEINLCIEFKKSYGEINEILRQLYKEGYIELKKGKIAINKKKKMEFENQSEDEQQVKETNNTPMLEKDVMDAYIDDIILWSYSRDKLIDCAEFVKNMVLLPETIKKRMDITKKVFPLEIAKMFHQEKEKNPGILEKEILEAFLKHLRMEKYVVSYELEYIRLKNDIVVALDSDKYITNIFESVEKTVTLLGDSIKNLL